ncbi:Holliday junction DNA helicase RuvA [Mesoplasma syrphidae]|uniref:Holliday junction branch migration complex subunit RuvA n=1 Tax=Mesoplasma syrphidae TaxID=225999 RepID=A0A2K9BYW8_9MOLU|nr:Holliday junction branch migration protein RuvA [Mesoplasma syrphidae]AUF83568.1 Holliday junction DNA helicase RuvA [Mesoplasma syrphidae]
MRNYIIGTVKIVQYNQVTIEVNSYGENFFILEKERPFLIINTEIKLYTATYKTEFEDLEFGFVNYEIYGLFKNLIKIKTVGYKTALQLLETYEVLDLLDIIQNGDLDKIMIIKGIGNFTAKLIIEILQKQYFNFKLTNKKEKLLVSLQKLGFKSKEIYQVLRKLDDSLTFEKMVEKAVLNIGQQ